ncbi:unnamed protein product, partial [Polarella glacialis]
LACPCEHESPGQCWGVCHWGPAVCASQNGQAQPEATAPRRSQARPRGAGSCFGVVVSRSTGWQTETRGSGDEQRRGSNDGPGFESPDSSGSAIGGFFG